MPGHVRVLILLPLLNALVARIAKGSRLVTVQQGVRLSDAADMGGGSHDCVRESGICVNANVRLHAEVPLITLPGLVHFGVAPAILILRRGRRGNDGRIDYGAFSEQQALLSKVGVDGGKDALGQSVGFEQAAEPEQGGGIRGGFPVQINANEGSNGLAVVDCIFDPLVRQSEALLGNVHARHALQADRRPAATGAFGIERFQLGHQCRPGRHGIDLAKKSIPPRALLLGGVLEVRKALLHNWLSFRYHHGDCRKSVITLITGGNKSECP